MVLTADLFITFKFGGFHIFFNSKPVLYLQLLDRSLQYSIFSYSFKKSFIYR
jgi:hypothetical protein